MAYDFNRNKFCYKLVWRSYTSYTKRDFSTNFFGFSEVCSNPSATIRCWHT